MNNKLSPGPADSGLALTSKSPPNGLQSPTGRSGILGAEWMDALPAALRQKKLSELTLPGSHDSGAYAFTAESLDEYQNEVIKQVYAALEILKHMPGMAGIVARVSDQVLKKAVADWGRAQNSTIDMQLHQGIRWFDLRTMMYQGEPHLFHGFVCHKVDSILREVRAFLDVHPTEIVVLYFSHMSNLTAKDHVDLARLIATRLGEQSFCDATMLKTDNVATLQENRRQVVIFYDSPLPSRSDYPWLLNQNHFYQTIAIDERSVGALVDKCQAEIAKHKSGSLNIAFTLTPTDRDVGMSIANQFNPFTGTHGLGWFTSDVRVALPGWFAANKEANLGIVSTDFVHDTYLLDYALRHMGLDPENPGDITAAMGAVAIRPDRPYVLVLDAFGHLWLNWWTGRNFEWIDHGTPPGSARIIASLGALVADNQRVYAFMLASDNNVWARWWSGSAFVWSNQGKPDGAVTIVKALGATTVDERVYMFVSGSDGNLWVNWWQDGWHWSNNGRPSAGVAVAAAMGTVAVDGSRPYVFVLGQDCHLWLNWWDGHHWHWHDQGLPTAKEPMIGAFCGAILVDNRPYVFVQEQAGHLWQHVWDGQNWSWLDQGVPTTGVGVGMSMGAVVVDGHRAYVFVRGSDGHLWSNWWTGQQWAWTDHGVPGPTVAITSSLGAVVLDGDRPYVFVLGSDGDMWANWWDGNNWRWSKHS